MKTYPKKTSYSKNDLYKLCQNLHLSLFDKDILVSRHAYRKTILKLKKTFDDVFVNNLRITSFVVASFRHKKFLPHYRNVIVKNMRIAFSDDSLFTFNNFQVNRIFLRSP